MKPINVSNTTLSYNRKGSIKFDISQPKRNTFGLAYCVICDEVFTKLAYNSKICGSKKCSRERDNARQRAYRAADPEKYKAQAKARYNNNSEFMIARQLAYNAKYREDPEWVNKKNAWERAYRRRKKKEE